MYIQCAIVVALLSAGMLAQTAAAPCPAERPVDEIIAEVHNQQSKKNQRNRNAAPQVTCIWGWCREGAKTPPTLPEPAPTAQVPAAPDRQDGSSSSKTPEDKCNRAMELVLEAAHNVDVGDYYFSQKNYRGALMRYRDAEEGKPEDIAIRVRLGRVFEKLNQVPQAIESYKEAQRLSGPEKWQQEAVAALKRLQPTTGP